MRLTTGSAPHIHKSENIPVMMGDMLVALLPVLCVAVYYYGLRALLLTVISVASCVLFELIIRRLMHRTRSIGDVSAVVTGVLLACCLPAGVPLWVPIAGSFFAIVVAKQLFGGLGNNLFNPAAAGICFLTVTWPGILLKYTAPFTALPLFANYKGGATKTVLLALGKGMLPDVTPLQSFWGDRAGALGTGGTLVLIVAGLYLLYRRIIRWQTPVAFLAVVALAAVLFPRVPASPVDSLIYELTSGSVLFVAIFMACDPATSPATRSGRALYGLLCGLFTVLLRYFGNYQEGAFFALLLMNPFAMSLDLLTWRPGRRSGGKGVPHVEKD